MLRATFLHSPGVGPETERRLWRQGASDWETFLRNPERWNLPVGKRELLINVLEESAEALEKKDFPYFARMLPSQHRWRVFPDVIDKIGYLDIETNGDTHAGSVTVVGLYTDGQMYSFVKGMNLHLFPGVVERCDALVTFNGNAFDIPILESLFPKAGLRNKIHIDLCPTLRRLGLKGGLKIVEDIVGIERSSETHGLNGWDAVRLWYQYQRGNKEALEILLKYNKEDCVNLEPLMQHAYQGLKAQLFDQNCRQGAETQ